MPEEWFDVAKTGGQTPNSVPVLPRGCQLQFEGSEFRYQHETGTDWKYFGGLSARGQKKDLMIPWQSSMLPIEESESGLQIAGVASGNTSDSLTANSLMLTVCGSRLVGHDVATGKLSPAFNHSQPLDLGYFPALQPRLVRNDDGQLMGLLLCEIVSLADCGNWTKPVTRFHLLSLDTAKPIWSFTTDCDPLAADRRSQWRWHAGNCCRRRCPIGKRSICKVGSDLYFASDRRRYGQSDLGSNPVADAAMHVTSNSKCLDWPRR